MLRIKSDTLRDELTQIFDKIKSLKEIADVGVPGDDMPGSDMSQEIFQVQMQGELVLVSLRLSALAEVLGES